MFNQEGRSDLFCSGNFKLHSGEVSDFKIDCDSLSDAEIATLARQLVKILPPFSRVEGVPRGGLRLEQALAPFCSGNREDPLLLADDVYTTGGSLEEQREDRQCIAAVLFARRPPTQNWVYALFTMENH